MVNQAKIDLNILVEYNQKIARELWCCVDQIRTIASILYDALYLCCCLLEFVKIQF